jgi:hypothetical protein
MSAFFEENQHFISIKLFKEMRGLPDIDRITHYEQDLKEEARGRFKAHYAKSTDFKHKRNFYSDAIDYFKDFEFRYLINSLYFENDAEKLLKDLGPKITRNLPAKFQDDFLLLELINKSDNPDFIDNHLSELFRDKLGLSLTSSISKNDTNNPEANKVSEWLCKSLKLETSWIFRSIVRHHSAAKVASHSAPKFSTVPLQRWPLIPLQSTPVEYESVFDPC